jgi:hypothetical protein
VRLSLVPRADNVLVFDAAIELAEAAPVVVEYGNPEAGWLRLPATPPAASHLLPIVRLRSASQYEVRVFTLDGAGCPVAAATASLTTGQLPRPLQVELSKVSGQASFPVAFMDNRLANPSGDANVGYLVAIDSAGEVVWYYLIPADIPTAVTKDRAGVTIKVRPNGNILYQTGQYGYEEITPDARSVRRIPTPAAPMTRLSHHDFLELPDGRILFLGKEDRPQPGPAGAERFIRGDTLWTVDPETLALERIWGAFDMLNPEELPDHWREVDEQAEDWTHANTVSIGPRGNVVLSLRNLDQVISLSPDLNAIEWRLGGPGTSFAFPDPGDRFYGQHDAREISPGRVLMFDNGVFRPEGEWSRGLELELDFAGMTARKVWEYRHEPDFYARTVGGAERLPNGNTVVNFGMNSNARNGFTPAEYGIATHSDGYLVLAVEAAPDGSRVWEHWLDWKIERSTRYRFYPATTLSGEQSIAPPPPLSRAAP